MKTSIRKSAGSKARKTTPAPKKKAAPTRTATLDMAIKDFEEAVKAFSKQDFAKAGPLFDSVVAGYPSEREICDRARVYGRIARSRTVKGPAATKSAEDLYYQGVLAVNDGRLDDAAEIFERVIRQDERSDRAFYALSAICCLRNDAAGAVENLGKAIALNPANRVQALNDPDFDGLREDASFMGLLGKDPERSV